MRFVRKQTFRGPAWGLVMSLSLGLPQVSAHADEPLAAKLARQEKQAKQPKAQAANPRTYPTRAKPQQATTQSERRASPQQTRTNYAQKAQTDSSSRALRTRADGANKSSHANLATRSPPPSKQLDTRNHPLPVARTGAGNGVGRPEDVKSARVHVPPPTTVDVPPPPAPETESEQDLRERLQATIFDQRDLPYSARLVGVRVKGGVITLHGQVNTDYERARVGQVVDRVRGGYQLKNEILVRNQSRLSTRPPGLLDPGPAQASRTR